MANTSPEDFEAPGNNLCHWQKKADSLLSAATVLRKHSGTRRRAHWGTLWPELMLWGCAVEALLKALRLRKAIASRDPELLLFREGRLQAKTHNLVELAHRAGFPLDEFQQKLLEQLTKAIKHGGRYPVPTSGELESYYWFGSEGDDELDAIVSALKRSLRDDATSD